MKSKKMVLPNKKLEISCGFLVLDSSNKCLFCSNQCEYQSNAISQLQLHIVSEQQIKIEQTTDESSIWVTQLTADDSLESNLKNNNTIQNIQDDEIVNSIDDSTETHEVKPKTKAQHTQSNVDHRYEMFHCGICLPGFSTFLSKESLRQHMRRHIQQKIQKPCEICKKTRSKL